MSNKKLVGLLMTIASSKELIKEFAHYIKEAHPSNAVHLTALLRYVSKKKKLTEDDFEREKIHRILFGQEAYRPRKISDFYTDSIKLTRNFLISKLLEKRPHMENFLFAESLDELQLPLLAKKNLEQNLEGLPDEEENHFAVEELSRRQIYYKTEKNLKEKKKNRHHLTGGFRALKIRNIIGELKYVCELMERKLLLGEPYEEGIEEMIEHSLADIRFRDEVPLVDILARAVYFLQNLTLESYYQLKETFIASLDILFTEKKEVLLILINGLIYLKFEDVNREYFDLYKVGVERGYFIEKGQMSPSAFNNIVRIACQVKQPQWAEQFVKEHLQYLNKPEELLGNIIRQADCFLCFTRREYTGLMEKLDKIVLEDCSYGFNKYNLQVKTLYELEDSLGKEELARLIKNYKDYVNYARDNKYISNKIKAGIFNFLNILAKIVDYPYKKYTREQLLAKLFDLGEVVIDKKWLLEKIQALK